MLLKLFSDFFLLDLSPNNGTHNQKPIAEAWRNRHHPDYPFWDQFPNHSTTNRPIFIPRSFIFAPALDLICLHRAFLSHDRWETESITYWITSAESQAARVPPKKSIYNIFYHTLNTQPKTKPFFNAYRVWFLINVPHEKKKGSFETRYFAPLPGSCVLLLLCSWWLSCSRSTYSLSALHTIPL